MHIIYRRPREPWAALGKTRVSNKCFEKCPFFGTFTTLKVLKEIIISQSRTSQGVSEMLITSQDFCSGMFLYKKMKKYDILYTKKVKNDYLEVK